MTNLPYSLKGKRIFVAGHRGMVGWAAVRRLATEDCEILTADRATLDLERQEAVESWMRARRPHAVIVAAAKVGGILANSRYPADFLYRNLVMETNLIHAAHMCSVEKLLFLGSSCIYPRLTVQPMTEEQFMTGPLEPTNESYAVAKIAGIKLCDAYRRQYGRDYISAMPTNLFGPGDNYHPENSHVIAALIARFDAAVTQGATEVTIWGSGRPVREFLYVDDCADALIFLMKNFSGEGFLNVGTGIGTSIAELAEAIAEITGFSGTLRFDPSKPDGMPHKVMDVSRLTALGWRARTPLREGLKHTLQSYRDSLAATDHRA